jgi:hypothetical protein
MDNATIVEAEAPWYNAYPAVKSKNVPNISRAEVLSMIHSGASVGRDFVLVDLRKNDHEVCNFRFCTIHRIDQL